MARKGTVLVTGASLGIGRELALEYARHGHDLVLVARTQSKLDELAEEIRERHGRIAHVVPMDLAKDGAARALFDRVKGLGLDVEVLVNNAGTGDLMPFLETDSAAIDTVLHLNVVVLTQLARLFVPPMVARGHGRVMNVASVAAFQPVPKMAVYAATKAYVLSLTEALSQELAGTGVTVTALCPGFVDTPLVQHLADELGREQFVPSFFLLDATEVAREGYEACAQGEVVHVNGRSYDMLVHWLGLQPRWFVRNFTGLLSRYYAG